MTVKILKRYVIVGMVFLGYAMFFVIHANVGMAVIAMTSPKNVTGPNGTINVPPEYKWDSMQRAVAVSSFSYGRLLGSALGIFVTRIGGSTGYFLGIIGSAIAAFCMPFFLKVDFWLFVAGNALTGTFDAISYTSLPKIWSRWAPPNERAKMISISLTGAYSGLIVTFLVAGWILHEWSWEMLFHVTGITALVWAFVWLIVVKNDPADDRWISDAERNFIKEQLETKSLDERKLAYPYKEILTSLPVWITCLGKFNTGIGVTFMMLYLPQYVKDTNDVNIKVTGYISVIPNIFAMAASPAIGFIFDYLRSKKILSLTNIHKLYACIGFFAEAITFLAIGLWSNFVFSITCMVIFAVSKQCVILQNLVTIQDLGPRYASFTGSIATFFHNIACTLTPLIFGFIVTSHSRLQWNICFAIFAAIFTGTGFIYIKFLSVKLQHWANYSTNKQLDGPDLLENKSLM